MSGELVGVVLSVVVALGLLVFVAAPLLRRDASLDERLAPAGSQLQELQSHHEMLLDSLRDLEDDRATDKIDETDYKDLSARLSAKAVEVMKSLDAAKADLERREAAAAPVLHPNARGRDE
ncbi:MAG: hypothetical protein GY716_13785 [bacterium]|nr:hypothetical protein [bacterium]